jgi:hypothetical protein
MPHISGIERLSLFYPLRLDARMKTTMEECIERLSLFYPLRLSNIHIFLTSEFPDVHIGIRKILVNDIKHFT